MYSQYLRLNVHVGESDLAVIRKARRLLSRKGKSPAMRAARKMWYREILEYHHEARELYRAVQLGDFR